jgi:hypothetical protein
MAPKDEELLETLRDRETGPDKGGLTPKAFDILDVTGQSYASDRLSEMANYGLVGRIAPGLYYLTDLGRDWLDEEIDASMLERAED